MEQTENFNHNTAWLLASPHPTASMSFEFQQDKQDEDAQLMRAVAAGDSEALHCIIEKWQRPVIAYCYRSCGNFSDAEDLAQTTFISLYRAAPRYEARAKFSTFLFHIAHRKLINYHRTQRRKPATPTAPTELPEQHLENFDARKLAEWEEIFSQALETLPEKQRTALLLLKQQELSYEEIAEIMDASTGAVKTWVHRARETVRSFFNTIDPL